MDHLITNNKISLNHAWVKPMYVHCMTELLETGESDFISRLLDIDKCTFFYILNYI